MITRIEIDGFKSFDDFALDLKPFTAVIGPNAGGKSNLIDAVRFVSTLLDRGVNEAVSEVRGRGLTLFHQRSDGTRVDRMRFALEGISPVTSGQSARRRCEIEVGVVKGKLDLLARRAEAVSTDEDHWLSELDCSTEWREHLTRESVWESSGPTADHHLLNLPFVSSSFLKLNDDVLREPAGEGELYPTLGRDGSALTAYLAFLESDSILAALHNSGGGTQLFVEEPENGLPPSRMRRLIGMMESHTTDFAIDAPGPTRQVVITSHSPVVLSAVPRENVVFLDTVTRIRDGIASDVTRARRLRVPGEVPTAADKGKVVLPHELARFSDGLDTAA